MADTITCGGCTATWTAPGAAHCSGCHRSFSGVGLFDAHRSQYGERGACLDPATLTVKHGHRAGEPLMYYRAGMWRGPESTDEQKAALSALRPVDDNEDAA
jgi:hypothetical protein